MTRRSQVVLEARGLRKSYGSRVAVDGVSFEIAPGETYGLLGPNGAGKTTTISMICGLLQPDAGEALVLGRRVSTDATEAKEAIGYVPQDIAIYPDLSARENLLFFGRLYGLDRRTIERRSKEVLELTGLSERAEDRTSTYSGGMKRRLNIGIALLHEPQLLVLDEPTVGVDPQSRNAILASVETLSRGGLAVLYTTHYMEEAERLCDRVGIIDGGQIKAEGARRDLVAMLGEKDRVRLAADGDLGVLAARLADSPHVSEAIAGDGSVECIVDDARVALPSLLASAAQVVAVTGVEVVEPDLEAVFLRLTGKTLRD
ncbi:MAG TPA: ABC transporter ATP-binding protein [Actinomycetota bacterium]|nr:ABC transporter ATP-binding protein [Actinomycetota bacterium]